MKTIDFSPLYRSTIGFDRLASLLDQTLRHDPTGGAEPPYNIELVDEQNYTITLAVAGFTQQQLELQVENGVLTVRGNRQPEDKERKFLYQGIVTRDFECKFSLADHVEVKGANLSNGVLTIELVKELPEAMKPRQIKISQDPAAIERSSSDHAA